MPRHTPSLPLKLSLCLLLSTVTPLTMAVDIPLQLRGAFGKFFGQVFHPQHAISIVEPNNKFPYYEFSPQKPHSLLAQYYARITPRTKKVWQVLAFGAALDRKDCKMRQTRLLDTVANKYGLPIRKHVRKLEIDGKIITVQCKWTREGTLLEMTYTDPMLEARSNDEYFQSMGSDIEQDASGL